MKVIAILFAITVGLLGCKDQNLEGVYVLTKLPANISEARLEIAKGVGTLTYEYHEKTFITQGKVKEFPGGFSLTADSKLDSKVAILNFEWQKSLQAWRCSECITGISKITGADGGDQFFWRKVKD